MRHLLQCCHAMHVHVLRHPRILSVVVALEIFGCPLTNVLLRTSRVMIRSLDPKLAIPPAKDCYRKFIRENKSTVFDCTNLSFLAAINFSWGPLESNCVVRTYLSCAMFSIINLLPSSMDCCIAKAILVSLSQDVGMQGYGSLHLVWMLFGMAVPISLHILSRTCTHRPG